MNQARLALLLCLSLSACAVQTGVHGGTTVAKGGDVHGSWAGHMSAQLDLRSVDIARLPVTAGLELEGRGQSDLNAAWTAGLQVGGIGDLSKHVALIVHGDVGIPGLWGTELEGYYAGLTTELPITPAGVDYAADRNRNYRWLAHHVAFVPYVRYRHYFLDGPGIPAPSVRLNDFGLGMALRIQFVSDIP